MARGGAGRAAKFAVQIAIRAYDFASRVWRQVSATVSKAAGVIAERFGRLKDRIKGIVDFGAKLGVVFATWGRWAFELGRKIAGVVTETSDLLGRIGDLRNKTGVGTSALQELAYAAGQTGAEAESLFKGIEAMSRKFGDMEAGGKELSSFLLKVGGPAFLKQARAAKTNEERLELMLVALGKIEGEEKRAAFAAKVFGKSGEDMVLMLGDGAEGLRRLRDEAHRFGVVQGPQAVATAEEFGDEMARVGAAWTGAKQTFGAEVMRQLLPQLKAMTEWIAQNPAKIREMAVEFATGVVTAVDKIAAGLKWVWENADAIGKGLAAAFAVAVAAVSPILGAIAALAALAAQGKPRTGAEKDKSLIEGHKRAGTIGGAMGLFENRLNEGGLFGLAAGVMDVGDFVSREGQILGEATDRRRRDNFVESESFNAAQRVLMLSQPSASGTGPDQSLAVELTINDPGGNVVGTPTVKADGVAAKVTKRTGQRTAGTGLP